MCLVKTPTTTNTAAQQKDLPVLRNPQLDGINPILKAAANGASSLRVDRTPDVQTPVATSGPNVPSSLTITRLSDYTPLVSSGA